MVEEEWVLVWVTSMGIKETQGMIYGLSAEHVLLHS